MKKLFKKHKALKFNCVRKILLIMKLTGFLLFIGLLQVSAAGLSQNNRVTLEMNNVPLDEFIAAIENQTDYRFVYLNETVQNKLITAKVKNTSVSKLLDRSFSEAGIDYKIILNKLVVITPNKTSDKSQQFVVTGTVTDENGDPVPGANVTVKGTTIGTITDLEGRYTISVEDPSSAVLAFSFVGYQTQEIAVADQAEINVSLLLDILGLEEVIVIGYGAVTKSDLTGSVASVKSEDIAAYPAIGVTQALQGRAAGVNIQANNGEPGSDYKVRIRGATSINSSSDPLFVVDGFPGATLPAPEDIASVEVLKDASATAIYGSRGANGVILVTTKQGQAGRTMVNFSSSFSMQKEIKRLDLLNAEQFAAYQNELSPGRYTPPYADTDWQDEILRTGGIQNYQLSVSGGSERITFYTSGIFYDQKGIVLNSKYKRYSVTSNINIKATERLNFGLNLMGNRSVQYGVKTQEGSGGTTGSGVIAAALQFEPTLGIYNPDGTFTIKSIGDPHDNPYALATQLKNEDVRDRLLANVYGEIMIFKGLTFRANLGGNIFNRREGTYVPTTLNAGFNVGGEGTIYSQKNTDVVSENYLTYTNKFDDMHELTVMGGYSYQSFRNENWTANGTQFITDANDWWDLDGASVYQRPASNLTNSELASWYGRVNYKLMDRYLVTVNARYDGSSRFAKNNKWAFFPSMALAWNINNESFMQDIEMISMLKARFSWGQTGNQAISPYESLAKFGTVFSVVGGQVVNAVRPTSVANDNLSWETTTQMNIGLDAGVFNNRIMLTADYYSMLTADLLFSVGLPEYSGYSSQLKNIGEVENKGVELVLSTRNLTGELKWNTDFNISFNRNKIVKLPDGIDVYYAARPGHIVGTDNTNILREGEPVGMYWGFIYDGVYQEGDTFIPGGGFEQEPGGEKYRDIGGVDAEGNRTDEPDNQLNNNDKTIIGNPHPDFIFGLNNKLIYKGFELNVFFQGTQGNDLYSWTIHELDRMAGNANATTDALDRWTPANTDTDFPKAMTGRSYKPSTRFIYDGSYIRLKNISLGYSVPASLINKLRIRSLLIYISGQNILTISDYPGFDPEVNYQSTGTTNSNMNLGLDYGSYPNAKTYTMGFKIGF